jgi:hypothetical protein
MLDSNFIYKYHYDMMHRDYKMSNEAPDVKRKWVSEENEMPRFEIDCRTGQVGIKKPQTYTNDQIMRRVKQVHYRLVVTHNITDVELTSLIGKIMSGTRNLHYLTTQENNHRLKDVASFIIREFSY